MKIRDFGVEMWMNAYENNCTYNLAETCVKSLTVQELGRAFRQGRQGVGGYPRHAAYLWRHRGLYGAARRAVRPV